MSSMVVIELIASVEGFWAWTCDTVAAMPGM